MQYSGGPPPLWCINSGGVTKRVILKNMPLVLGGTPQALFSRLFGGGKSKKSDLGSQIIIFDKIWSILSLKMNRFIIRGGDIPPSVWGGDRPTIAIFGCLMLNYKEDFSYTWTEDWAHCAADFKRGTHPYPKLIRRSAVMYLEITREPAFRK